MLTIKNNLLSKFFLIWGFCQKHLECVIAFLMFLDIDIADFMIIEVYFSIKPGDIKIDILKSSFQISKPCNWILPPDNKICLVLTLKAFSIFISGYYFLYIRPSKIHHENRNFVAQENISILCPTVKLI